MFQKVQVLGRHLSLSVYTGWYISATWSECKSLEALGRGVPGIIQEW